VGDGEGGRLVEVNAKTGAATVVGGGEGLLGITRMETEEGRVVVLGNKGLVECLTAKQECVVIGGKEEDWGDIKDMGFYGGNIYLLGAGGEKLWKYTISGGGLGGKKEWLAGDQKLTGGIKMAIDGNIWIISGQGVEKYLSGRKQEWQITGETLNWGQKLDIFTATDADNLYILDEEKARVVIINKEGGYLGQVVAEELYGAGEIVVNETEKKIWWLADGRVWEAEL
jgi:hypothetical protein